MLPGKRVSWQSFLARCPAPQAPLERHRKVGGRQSDGVVLALPGSVFFSEVSQGIFQCQSDQVMGSVGKSFTFQYEVNLTFAFNTCN